MEEAHLVSPEEVSLSALALLYSVKGALPSKLRALLYRSTVLPHLDYCAVVWAECCKDDANKLERIQNRGMRLILDEGYDHPSASMRSRLAGCVFEAIPQDKLAVQVLCV